VINRLTSVWLAGFALLSAAARGETPKQDKAASSMRALRAPEAVERGRKLFNSACSGCHGLHGEGGRGPKLSDGELVRGAKDEKLFSSIKNGVPGAGMPPFPLPDEQIRELLGFIRSLSAPAADVSLPGDPAAGRALFAGPAGCIRCHRIRGEGGFLGPDLTNIGAARTLLQIRNALVKPELRGDGEYRGVRVVLKTGRVIEGVMRNATNYAFEVQDNNGELHPLAAQEIEKIEYRRDPLMPSDYASKLSAAEIDHLIAFLSRQTARPRPNPDQEQTTAQ
jgi:putative heme-binding domain-containing protein